MAKSTNTRGYRNVVSIVRSWPTHIKRGTEERKKNLLFLFLANAGHSCSKAGISQLPGPSLPPQHLGQPSTCMISSPSIKVSGQRQHRSGQGKKAVGLQPAVAILAQHQFLKQQHQEVWCWRPVLPQFQLSHLDEDADPHASPKIHVTLCNHH